MNNKSHTMTIDVLRFWFMVHFIVDFVIALPLFIFPIQSLKLLGWNSIDPIMTRIVAAALFGIGIESYLGRNSTDEQFIPMLNLKIIWSFFASLAILVSIYNKMFSEQIVGWVVFLTFGIFHVLWVYYRLRFRQQKLPTKK